MPALCSFDYATLRVVPRVERDEFVNAGVILHCSNKDFLAAEVALDERRLLALDPDADLELIREHLAAIPKIAAGDRDAGPIARMPRKERFLWLVAPRSTVVQVSPVHAGLCDSPEAAVARLMAKLVR